MLLLLLSTKLQEWHAATMLVEIRAPFRSFITFCKLILSFIYTELQFFSFTNTVTDGKSKLRKIRLRIRNNTYLVIVNKWIKLWLLYRKDSASVMFLVWVCNIVNLKTALTACFAICYNHVSLCIMLSLVSNINGFWNSTVPAHI